MKKRRESSSPNNHLSDHISDLPDHILISFLDLLPAKCAVQTSVLSSRWKYLWTFVSNIVFDEDQKCKEDHANESKFSNFVNSFFRFHKELTIKRIRFSFCSGDELNSHTEEWIKHVMRRKIEELHISFSTRQLYANELFPFGLLVQNREEKQYSFESLKLSPCTAFSSLRILCLDCVDISDGMLHGLLSALQYMIAGANNLEWLHNLFINLEELEIFGFYCGEETMFFVIDILLRSAPHLKKLILRDFESWGTFPRLEEADYNAWVPPDCLINNLRMIKLNMFRGCDEGVDLVELLLKSSEALESLIIMVDSGIFRRENGREVVKDADKLMGICRKLLTLPRASMDAKIIISPYDRI